VIKFSSATAFNSSSLIFVGSNYNDYQNLSISSNFMNIINTKYFNPSKQSVLIVHGWRENYKDEMTSTLVDAFLTRPEYNIIFADWSRYADNINYNASAESVPGVSWN
jgi:hypothetical protein